MPRNQKELLPYFRTKLCYAEKKKRERERITIKKKTPEKYRNFQNDKTMSNKIQKKG